MKSIFFCDVILSSPVYAHYQVTWRYIPAENNLDGVSLCISDIPPALQDQTENVKNKHLNYETILLLKGFHQ
jgi:hypothetical protein